MKNIHVLPTDKPSRLYIDKKGKYSLDNGQVDWKKHQNIYITSDEEIKKGDFFYSVRGHIEKAIINYPKGEHFGKLILTTDQNLIKGGVQAIDDDFLEWFVKNPSCEEIEVDWVDFSQSYFIKIPKEELKQETIEEDLDEIKNIRLWLKDRKQRFIKQLKNKQ